jgi:RimJ/RimL family protein N-acetyltransferase
MGTWNGVKLAKITLTSARLTLRPFGPQDIDGVHQAAQDELMQQFLPLPNPYTRADAKDYVLRSNEGRRTHGQLGVAITETATGRLVGSAALRLPVPGHPDAEIGYAVYPWGRGLGYAAETSDALARWGLEQGLARISIRCSVLNVASARSALAAGFGFEGLQRQPVGAPIEDEDALFVRVADDSGERTKPFLPPLPADGLSDGVLMLRVVEPDDAAAMIEELQDPVTRGWEFTDAAVDPGAITMNAARSRLQWLVGPIGRMSMVELASGEVAGSMQLRLGGPPAIGGIGYGVRPGFRGHGYTARGLRLLSEWAFTHAGIHRLELGAKVANVASQKSALNAGFQGDGIHPGRLRNPDGTFSDEAQFCLLNPTVGESHPR